MIYLDEQERIGNIISKILDENPDRVFLQVPDGLKKKIKVLEDRLDDEVEVVASLEPCYGACDIKDIEARNLGCDLLVHIGHTRFCRDEEVKTMYFPWYYDMDPVPVLKSSLGVLGDYRKIGLLTTANFLHSLEKARGFLESKGFEIFLGEGKRTEKGQILGCDVSSALSVEDKVDCYVYIGSGKFHPLGLALKTDKPIFRLDFEEKNLLKLDFDRFKRQQIVAKENARQAESFGIVITTKKGQSMPDVAFELRKKLLDCGKDVYIFVMDEITKDKLEGIDVDCLVNTACPRIAVEHRTGFRQPVLNKDEVGDIFGFE